MHVRSIGTARHFSNSIGLMEGIVHLSFSDGTAPLAHQTERNLLCISFCGIDLYTSARYSAASGIDQNKKKHPWRTVTEGRGWHFVSSALLFVGLLYDCTVPMLMFNASHAFATRVKSLRRTYATFTKSIASLENYPLEGPHLVRHRISLIPGIEVLPSLHYVLCLLHLCGYSIY